MKQYLTALSCTGGQETVRGLVSSSLAGTLLLMNSKVQCVYDAETLPLCCAL